MHVMAEVIRGSRRQEVLVSLILGSPAAALGLAYTEDRSIGDWILYGLCWMALSFVAYVVSVRTLLLMMRLDGTNISGRLEWGGTNISIPVWTLSLVNVTGVEIVQRGRFFRFVQYTEHGGRARLLPVPFDGPGPLGDPEFEEKALLVQQKWSESRD